MDSNPHFLHIVFLRSLHLVHPTPQGKTHTMPSIKPIRSLATLAVLTALLGASAAMAQPKSGEGPGGNGGPPAEALTACKSAKASDSCSFSSPNGTVSGTCQAPQGRALACVPAQAQGQQGQGGNSSSAPRQ
jgi:hypothetical protein